jgi:ribosome modulation factor
MTNDQFEVHVQRIARDPIYEDGYRAALDGRTTSRLYDTPLERGAWADGWLNGATEAIARGETIAEWLSLGRGKVTVSAWRRSRYRNAPIEVEAQAVLPIARLVASRGEASSLAI